MSPWKIRAIERKGLGVVSTENIEPGTLLMKEAPLLEVNDKMSEEEIALELRNLTNEARSAFLSLHNNSPGEDNPLSNIVRCNSLFLRPSAEIGGIFKNISRINHSCRPNAIHTWHPNSKHETVYAVRPIPIDTEVTISYHSGGTSAARQDFLRKSFGFDCHCEACSLSSDDLSQSDSRLALAELLHEKVGDGRTVCNYPGTALIFGKELLGIYRKENIEDDRISRLYYDLFQIFNIHGDQARAGVFAKKYCDAKRISAGPDGKDLLEMIKFIAHPSDHPSYMDDGQWKTEACEVPEVINDKWLWRGDLPTDSPCVTE